jgi:hypothetical protein
MERGESPYVLFSDLLVEMNVTQMSQFTTRVGLQVGVDDAIFFFGEMLS